MLWLSGINTGTVIMDIAAFLLLVGMMVNTRLYRERGRIDDKLYFYLLIMNMVLAFFDGMIFFLDESPIGGKAVILLCLESVFSILITFMPLLTALLMDYMWHRQEERVYKLWRPMMIGVVYSVVIVVINWGTGILYYTDANGIYTYAPLYPLVYVPGAVFSIYLIICSWQINRKLAASYLLLIAARLFLSVFLGDMSSTTFAFAMFLVYVHLQRMNEAFYEEGKAL